MKAHGPPAIIGDSKSTVSGKIDQRPQSAHYTVVGEAKTGSAWILRERGFQTPACPQDTPRSPFQERVNSAAFNLQSVGVGSLQYPFGGRAKFRCVIGRSQPWQHCWPAACAFSRAICPVRTPGAPHLYISDPATERASFFIVAVFLHD